MTKQINKIGNVYYLLLLLAFLPSGSIYGVPIKAILVLVNLAYLFYYFISERKLSIQKPMKLLILSAILTIPWAMLSIKNGFFDGAKSFYKTYAPWFLLMILTYAYIDNGLMDFNKAFKCLKIAAIIFLSFKVLIEILYLLHIIDTNIPEYIFGTVFNTVVVFGGAPGGLIRMMNANDDFVLIVMGVIILTEDGKHFYKGIIWALLGLFYVLIIYSRVTIMVYFVLLLTALILYFINHRNKQGMITLIALAVVALGVVIFALSNATIRESIFQRFLGAYASSCDGWRVYQFSYLYDGFKSSPIIGTGLGAYIREVISNTTNIHSYELEWLSYFYQLGVVGVLLIMGSMIYSVYIAIFSRVQNKQIKIYLLVAFLIWALRPLVNPNLFSSHSAVVLTLLIIIAHVYGEQSSQTITRNTSTVV